MTVVAELLCIIDVTKAPMRTPFIGLFTALSMSVLKLELNDFCMLLLTLNIPYKKITNPVNKVIISW